MEFMATKAEREIAPIHEAITVCTLCPLCESRTHAVPGEGPVPARAMIIGEAPGRDEDKAGRPFVGAAGRSLNGLLEGAGLERGDFFVTNIVKCRPPKNRKPKSNEVAICVGNYLRNQIDIVNPRVIALLGTTALAALLPDIGTVAEAREEPIERDGRIYVVSYHPASRFYREDLGARMEEDFERLAAVLKGL
jgi:DNA polymerase